MTGIANTSLQISSLDFDDIKDSLKAFMASQSDFADYDYESSAMATLIDLLAFNTYQNSFYLNMVGNEAFLNSAQLRNNVVARAKLLGYTPTSCRGASAVLDVTISPDDSPASITISKDTTFTSTIDSVDYKFVTPSAFSIVPNEGVYSGSITITEGNPLTHQWTYDTNAPERFILPNVNVDTTSIIVQVQTSVSDTTITTHTLANDIREVTATSNIYFLQETVQQRYEILFGDGVIGKALTNGNIVIVQYRVCNGSLTNGANNFVSPSSLGGYSSFTTTISQNAAAGANAESVSSIKFNAPKHFSTQNRAVSVNDYKSILLREAPDIEAVSVWGGQENDPPIYGKVYIAAKPSTGPLLSQTRKDQLTSLLSDYSVMSVDPVFVDASYTFVKPSIEIRYDNLATQQTAAQIASAIEAAVINFETDNLGQFSTKFRYVDFLNIIDQTNAAIKSVLCDIEMQKRFIPITGTAITYKLAFNNPIKTISSTTNGSITQGTLTSTVFGYNGLTGCRFDDNGEGVLRIYTVNSQTNQKSYNNLNAGTIDYITGLVTLESINFNSYEGLEFKLDVVPAKSDVNGIRNQLLLFADASVSVYNDNNNTIEHTTIQMSTEGISATTNTDGVNIIVF